MSIINQALKKAQRERLLTDMRPVSQVTPLSPSGRRRGRLLMTIIVVTALGLGTVLLPRLTALIRHVTAHLGLQATRPYAPVTIPRRPSAQLPAVPPLSASTAGRGSPRLSDARSLPPPPEGRPDIRPDAPPSAAFYQKEKQEARNLFDQAVEIQKTGQPDRALALLQQAVNLDADLKEAYNGLGNLFYQKQQYDQAALMYQKALDLDRNYAKARNNLGSTYLRLSRDKRAVAELHKALEADNTYGLAHYNLACVYARAGDAATAVQYLRQAITLEPQARIWARTDDDFSRIRTAPEMQHLLGPS